MTFDTLAETPQVTPFAVVLRLPFALVLRQQAQRR